VPTSSHTISRRRHTGGSPSTRSDSPLPIDP
jgi:hypothetical protein